MEYKPVEIEKKWQAYWEEQGTFIAPDNFKKEKFYGLIEFPYPSGDGLHVGHLRSSIAMDVIARQRRMAGFNVLYPIGMDAFGLPAENYAVKTNTPPQVTTKKNIANFNRQLKSTGYSFDWSRFLTTTDPEYYQWTQWIFLQMFKKGLAYKSKENINWCTKCKIGLANEEVVGGVCERCGGQVIKKEKEQWLLRITKYADRLIAGLDQINFLETIKKQQKDWIGKSEGAEINFKIGKENLKVFTTRPDTLFGVTFIVLAPEHELVDKLKDQITNYVEVKKYIDQAKTKSDLDRDKDKTGLELKGLQAINPVNNEALSVFIADYVMTSYGTGAIMAVPAHDQRDWEFAKKYKLEIRPVIKGGDIQEKAFVTSEGQMINSEQHNGLSVKDFQVKIIEWLEKNNLGKQTVNYKLHDWIFSRQRYWGEPIPMVYCQECAKKKEQVLILHGWEATAQSDFIPALKNNLEAKGYEVLAFDAPNTQEPKFEEWYKFITQKIKENKLENFNLIGHSMGGHLALKLAEEYRIKNLVLVSPVGFKSSNEYFSQFKKLSTEELAIFKKYQDHDLNIKQVKQRADNIYFIFGDQDRWITKEIREYYIANFKDIAQINILANQGHFTEGEGVKDLPEVNNLFVDQTEILGWLPVPETDLPIILPDLEDFQPTDTGESPLAKLEEWVNTKCPVCGGPAKRETDVMPNWAGSNWYFIRYCDPRNNKQMIDVKKANYWLPVDWYNGGMEHTNLHLLYSRFVYKFLYDLGVVPQEGGDEPYQKRTAQGMILAGGGVKMSKSKGNVINPDSYIAKYGADTVRTYEMFMGPFDQAIAWDDKGVIGVFRFLNKVWNLYNQVKVKAKDEKANKLIHQTIKKVSADIEKMNFNTAVAALMILVNYLEKQEAVTKDNFIILLKLLSPFAPHLTEELWQLLGHKNSLAYEEWPVCDQQLAQEQMVKIGIQINGKLRDTIELDFDSEINDQLKQTILDREKIKKYLVGQEVIKFIYVKNKIISIVIK